MPMFSANIPYVEMLRALPGGEITAFLVLLVGLSIVFSIALMIALGVFCFIVRKTKTSLDDRVAKVLQAYVLPVSIMTALLISLELIYPAVVLFGGLSSMDLYIVVMLGIAGLLASSLADALLLWYGIELREAKAGVKEEDVYPFVRNIARITIVLLFIVFMLQRLGFDTTAIITGLGIGGLAVALALQDTLANFFAGVHILVDKPFRRGDYIKMESGLEGTVKEIGWRTTRISALGRDRVVVPNSKLAGSTVRSYSRPKSGETGVLYEIGVGYKEDIDKVDKLITQSLKKVAEKNEHMQGKTIWVRFDSFGDYALKFKFGYIVNGYTNQWAVLKDVNRELFYSFKKNKIEIPFPTRVVYRKK